MTDRKPPKGYIVWDPNMKTSRRGQGWDWAADGSVGLSCSTESEAVTACWSHRDAIAREALAPLCRVIGLSVEAAMCLSDSPTVLTQEEIEYGQKIAREIEDGQTD